MEHLANDIKAPIRPENQAPKAALKGIQKALQTKTDLVGLALHGAANTLIENWLTAIDDGNTDNLVDDVTDLIDRLEGFKAAARNSLPVQNGGFGRNSRAAWLKQLARKGVVVYETDAGGFGFTGCDCDKYTSYDDALNGALQAHPEITEMT